MTASDTCPGYPPPLHTHTHTHTHTYKYIHTHTQIHIHAHTNTDIHICTYINTLTHISYIYAHINTPTCTYNKFTYRCTHTCAHMIWKLLIIG